MEIYQVYLCRILNRRIFMEAKKGQVFKLLLGIMILSLFIWYVVRINAMIKFNEEILVSLQTYAEKERDDLIYIFQIDSEPRQWTSEIKCKELSQNEMELRKKIFFNQNIVLGVEKGTIYIYRNERCFWVSIISILGILVFGIKILLLQKGNEEDEPLISERFKNRMKDISKNVATDLARSTVISRIVRMRRKKK